MVDGVHVLPQYPHPLPSPHGEEISARGREKQWRHPLPASPGGRNHLKGAKPGDGAAEAVVELDRWLPAQRVLGSPDIGPAGPGVVLGERLVLDRALTAAQIANAFGQVEHGDLFRVAQVDRIGALGPQETDDAGDEAVDIAQTARLIADSIDRDGLSSELP